MHALIGKLGRASLTRRVLRCAPASVSVTSCRLASPYIVDLTYNRVNAISVGAGIFYAWVSTTAEAFFSLH